jgi:hypothetical protein
MAWQATVEIEIDAATGNALYGGAFDPVSGTPGTNYAWGAGQTVISWLAAGGTNTNDLASTSASSWLVLTSAARNFVAADVGNIINITAGTNFTAGRYQIISVAANAATLDRACGATGDASAGSGYLGGAWAGLVAADIQTATTKMVAGNKIWIKYNASAYTLPSAITAGKAGTAVLPILLSGYYATHGDNPSIASGQQPTISHSTYKWTFAEYWQIKYLTHTIATTSSTQGVVTGNYNVTMACKFVQTSTGVIFYSGDFARIIGCEMSGCKGAYAFSINQAAIVVGCYIHDCNCSTAALTCTGQGAAAICNIIESCTIGINVGMNPVSLYGNTVVNCSKGISSATNIVHAINNIVAYCGTGIIWTTQTDINFFLNNNIYGCTTPTSGVATTGSYAPIGGTTADPEFVTPIATGTTATTNASPGTTFTATGLLAGVAVTDYLCVWSGTGATAGVYAIASVAGAPNSITLATSPGNSASGIKWGIVKGGTTTNLSLAPTSDCLGAGYGISLGVG